MPSDAISENKIIEMSGNRLTKEEAQKLLSFLHLNQPKIQTFHDRITELLDKRLDSASNNV